MSTNSVKENFKKYLLSKHKRGTSSEGYIRNMPKIEKWFIENGLVGQEFNIWEDISSIKSIDEKLSTTFKSKWKELNRKERNFYSSPWNAWSKFNSKPMPITTTTSVFKNDLLYAIKTKPFVLLAGISGTGKSRLARTLAYNTCSKEELRQNLQKPGNFELIPVRPNWHDSSELMGYVSRISGEEKFISTTFLKFIGKAWKNLETPFILCLDEMNLAPVEQYFAEYLSIIETRQVQDKTVKTDFIISKASFENGLLYDQLVSELQLDSNEFSEGIGIPSNLVVIGTVNMDETTHSFSRKVLDRAMTFEMNQVDLKAGLESSDNEWSYPEKFISAIDVIGSFTSGSDVYQKLEEREKVLNFLSQINDTLEGTPFKIAYRVRDEFLIYCYYASLNQSNTAEWLDSALDEMTCMKILSRIEGDEAKTGPILEKLKLVLSAEYKKSYAKLVEMEVKLATSGYTSFWA